MSIDNSLLVIAAYTGLDLNMRVGIVFILFLAGTIGMGIQDAYSQQNVTSADSTDNASNITTKPAEPIARNIEESTYSNSTLDIFLSSVNDVAGLTYYMETFPSNGKVAAVSEASKQIPGGKISYTPNPSFTGTEVFTYVSKNTANATSDKGLIEIIVKSPSSPFIENETTRNLTSYILAIIIILIITLIAKNVITKIRGTKTPGYKSRFSDIIRGHDMDPGLSTFQFLLWTFVLMFAFISVYFVRIFGGVSEPPQAPLPIYLLAIAGISVATPILSTLISSYKYADSNPVQFNSGDDSKPPQTLDSPSTSGQIIPKIRPGFGEMLREFGKPTLARFQMFAWTWIGITVYLAVFFSTVSENSQNVQNLAVPDVDPTLVILMGLSQFAFLGIKTAASNEIQISMIYPKKVRQGGTFSIFGKEFGEEMQTLYIDSRKINYQDNLIVNWTSDRIDVIVPNDLINGSYDVVVVKGGAAKKSKEKIEIESASTNTNTNGRKPNNIPKVKDLPPINIQKDEQLDLDLKDNNPNLSNSVRFIVEDRPSHGEVTLDPTGQKIVYKPNQGYIGDDSFTYTAIDNNQRSEKGNIKISIS